ncbi:MAG: hypothetical protein Q9160_005320 [Pyrenula sp. 1 TL-2023]
MVLRRTHPPSPSAVEFLILGAGWTSQFLIPLLESSHVTYAATTTTGRDGTMPFKFDPDSDSTAPYETLPSAKTILITFPLKGRGQSKLLTSLYSQTHEHPRDDSSSTAHFQWIQLGSTGIFASPHWNTHTSPHDLTDARAIAEDELLSLGNGCVLNLAGLYGGPRDPRTWVTRVATTKEAVKAKNALHLIHGEDVARGILGVHSKFAEVGSGKRWLLTDLRVYDWWDLMSSWAKEVEKMVEEKDGPEAARKLDYARWVGELMRENGVEALPRGAEQLGRVLDSSAFWEAVGVWPEMGRVR